MSRYEIRWVGGGEVLSRHRSRQAALDAWREQVPAGEAVVIVLTYADGTEHPVVEGRWLEGIEPFTHEPGPCHRCGSVELVPVVYGYPGPELGMASERGEIELGGCDPSFGPTNRCRRCGAGISSVSG